MKYQTFGLSSTAASTTLTYSAPRLITAINDYRANRENGETQDNPSWSANLPGDGKFSWLTPKQERSQVKYTEGERDKAWVKEKDENYISRLSCLARSRMNILIKDQTFGLSSTSASTALTYSAPRLITAINDYRANRENGETQDNPSWSLDFPADGKFSWLTPKQERSQVKYKEGKRDKAWMKEKDENYLIRLEREGKLSQDEDEYEHDESEGSELSQTGLSL